MIEREFDAALKRLAGTDAGGKKYLLAVSGGIDSMCMADLFLHSPLHLSFGVAHANFSLREGDCDLDMESVRTWAERNSVPFYVAVFDTNSYAKKHSLSTQMAARELRYKWFAEVMDAGGYDYLCVAHNMDDSVETVFLNLVRGTGVRGLAGIPVSNGRIIRPLLSVPRKHICEYVLSHGVSYRDDRTNFETHYSRNKIRNIIFPEFRKINPSFLDTVYRSTGYFAEAAGILDGLYREKFSAYCEVQEGRTVVRTDLMSSDPHKGYWLYRILGGCGFNPSQVHDVERATEAQAGKIFRSDTHEAVTSAGEIRIYPLGNDAGGSLSIPGEGTYSFNGRVLQVKVYPVPSGFSPIPAEGQLFMSADSIEFPVTCRSWQPADSFRPFGMRKGKKKLSDFFTDLKLDRREKSLQPVLSGSKGIICLPGLRIDDRYRVDSHTEKILEVTLR